MTRESKIGLIVAGSFLCLVCIVVASKWNRGGTAPADPEEQTFPQQMAALQDAPKAKGTDAKKKDAATKGDGSQTAPGGDRKLDGLPALTPPLPAAPMLPAAPSLDVLPMPPALPRPDATGPASALPGKPDSLPLPPALGAKPDTSTPSVDAGGFPMFPDLPVKPADAANKPGNLDLRLAAPILQVQDDKK
ncbi:MAG: hypothetical protein HYR84_05020, partial [Planctomycetes bacterium]|nr:hypothetical protein [Planctomycetota bacterium]